MGVAPKREPKTKEAPKLKVVATMVLASCRMKRQASEWAQQKKLKASLVKGLENLRNEQRQGKGKKGRLITR